MNNFVFVDRNYKAILYGILILALTIQVSRVIDNFGSINVIIILLNIATIIAVVLKSNIAGELVKAYSALNILFGIIYFIIQVFYMMNNMNIYYIFNFTAISAIISAFFGVYLFANWDRSIEYIEE